MKDDIARRKAKILARRAELSAEQQTLFEKQLQGKSVTENRLIPRRQHHSPTPLSLTQHGLWFLHQLNPGSDVYHVSEGVRLRGQLNVAKLNQSLNEVVRRHEILRTTFSAVDGHPMQIIAPEAALTLLVVDLQEVLAAVREDEARRITLAQSTYPFDLTAGPLTRCTLLQLGEDDAVFLLTMHHIISDGWSVGIFVEEMIKLYHLWAPGRVSPLPELSVQYGDFALWQRHRLQGETLQTKFTYWRKQLAGAPLLLTLPAGRLRFPVQTFSGKDESFQVEPEMLHQLKEIGRQTGATLFMILEAAFAILLARYSAQVNIVIGTPTANRISREIEPLIGFFVNTLALHNDLSGNPTFRDLLDRVRHVIVGAQEHQDLPFDMLVQELYPNRDLSHNPIFQVMFSFGAGFVKEADTPGLRPSPWSMESAVAMFDLVLGMGEDNGRLIGGLRYNTDLFDSETIVQMAKHFRTLLAGIAADPDQHISEYPLLTEQERQHVLGEWHGSPAEITSEECIHQLFDSQVKQRPDAVAVVSGDHHLTYGALDRQANQLARYLQTLGAAPEVRIGICLEDSLEMVIGLLGILKAGGCCVPLPPAYANTRLARVVKDAAPLLMVTRQRYADRFSGEGVPIICLDQAQPLISQEAPTPPTTMITADNLAQVIYAMASPTPAGTMMAHRELSHGAKAHILSLNLDVDGRIFQPCCLSVAGPVSGIILSLLAGATLCLAAEEVVQSKPALLAFLRRWQVTAVLLPPPLLSPLPVAELPKLRTVVAMGDAFPANMFGQWTADGRQCYHMVGSGAAAVYAAAGVGHMLTQRAVIGRPAADSCVYLLDAYLNVVPVGVPGELYVGGQGLARGYHGVPWLTAVNFIPNPFDNKGGTRLFKTGERACARPDGTLELLGRADSPVMIRGRPIELGQIETVLRQHPAVQEAVIVVHTPDGSKAPPADSQLIAYVVLHQADEVPISVLRRFLKEKLPAYLLPSLFVLLDALPLTPGAQVDQQALPLPETGQADATAQHSERAGIDNEVASRRDELAARQDKLSAAKQALLMKKLRGKKGTS